MKRVVLRVTGKVQSVGFRWYCQQRAIEYGVTGYAKNESDGSVTVAAQGDTDRVDQFIESIRRGPKTAAVSNVEIEERLLLPTEAGFRTA